MLKKTIFLSTAVFLLFSHLTIHSSVFAGSAASEYLCGFAMQFYRMGRYEDALTEFKKVLLIDPENKTAQEYINNIFQNETASTEMSVRPLKLVGEEIPPLKEPVTRKEAISRAFKNLAKEEFNKQIENGPEKNGHNIA